jgi:hypothetical protein
MVFGDIGAVVRDQALDDLPHLLDVLGRARLDIGLEAAKRGHVLVELALGFFRDLADRVVQRQAGIFLRRARINFVVHVGDVADIFDVVGAIEVAQQPVEHVEDDDRARIADMGEVIDRRPAHIHAHIRRIERAKRLLPARQRVVKLQFHSVPVPAGRNVRL